MVKELLLPLFDWLGTTPWGKAIADSKYAFAIIEVFHLFGIILLLGGASLMALRLMGWSMKEQKVSDVARQLRWYTLAGLLTMLVTGVLMTSSIPNKYYHSVPFWWKMGFFWSGVIFHFTLYRKVTRSDNTGYGLAVLTALLTVVLWYTTGAFGRAIGFY
jgi:cytochrome bd-type quinol oxidase subunit 2